MHGIPVSLETGGESCRTCTDCKFTNVQDLSRLVKAEVNRALADEPRMLPQFKR